MRHTLYIEPDEEITSIVDKIKKVKEKEIAVVAPKGSLLLQSLVNLRLLQRATKKSGLKIDLITTDSVGKNLALQAGLPVYRSLKDTKPETSDIAKPKDEVLVANSESEPINEDEDLNVKFYRKGEEEKPDFKTKSLQDDEAEDLKEEAKDSGEKEDLENGVEKINSEDDIPEVNEEIKEKSGFIARSAGEIHSREHFEEDKAEVIDANQDEDTHHDYHVGHSEPMKQFSTPSVGAGFQKVSALKNKRRMILLGVGLALVFVIVGLALLLVPHATVSILVKGKDYKKDMTAVILSNDAVAGDNEDVSMKGSKLTKDVEVTDGYSATGKKDIGTKTAGSISVINSWDADLHSFVAGTKLTSGGKTFITTDAFTVPGAKVTGGTVQAGSVKVNIEATENGDSFNIDAGKFVIVGAPSLIYGQSSEKLTGGSSKLITIVSSEDLDAAKNTEIDKAKTELIKQIKAENPTLTIIDEAVKTTVSSDSSSDNVGSQTDKFTYNVKMNGVVNTFVKTDLLAKLQDTAEATLERNEKLVVAADKEIIFKLVSASDDGNSIKLLVPLEGKVIPNFNETKIKDNLLFKNSTAIENSIKQQSSNIETVKVDYSPSFWKRTAVLKSNIKVIFTYE